MGNGKPRQRLSEADRFERHVNRGAGPMGPDGTPCDLWTGSRFKGGYGAFTRQDGSRASASRHALEVSLGRRLEGWEEACHSCDNPPCVNASHLSADTKAGNMADMIRKRRNSGQWTAGGQRVSTLTDAQVQEIRRRFAAGDDTLDIATTYGLSASYVSNLAAGRYRKDVPGPIPPRRPRHYRKQKAA